MQYEKGDVVQVWSLQSFHGGGFLDGVEGIVSQDQYGGSVLVSVPRNIGGETKVDLYYEVYPQQLKLVTRPTGNIEKFLALVQELKDAERLEL